MRSIIALVRAAFLTASSYRVQMVLSFAGLLASVIPVYFISGALQPIVQHSIEREGGQYFGFLIIGMAATFMFSSAVSAFPAVLGATISSGTMEALLVTRTPLYQIMLGTVGYMLLSSALQAALLVGGAAVVGVHLAWAAAPLVGVIVLLMVTAYLAIGLFAAALVLVFRTSGPLTTMVIAGSGLLGGVYYSTSAIPSWLHSLSVVIPVTYALRAMRMLLLGGASMPQVAHDVLILALMAVALLAVSCVAFARAMRYARSAGTLSQY